MLPDAAHLQEEEAAFANRHGTSRHHPALPLFTLADAERVLARVARVDFDVPFTPRPGVDGRFRRAGHILGAATVECAMGGRRLVFSGDLGRYGVPIVVDPEPVREADVLIVESTYGDREHPAGDPADDLAAAVADAAAQRGWLLIPAFAIGRAQEILYDLRRLEGAGRIPRLPVYLDSPSHPGNHDVRRAHRGARR
jgi:metallo-beta-lactamase family protein